jgi:hypothetical protein
MKNLKTKLAAIIMTGFLLATTTFAKDGMLMSDFNGGEPTQTCTETTTNDLGGMLMSDFTGVIITGFTGVIITGAVDTDTTCNQ